MLRTSQRERRGGALLIVMVMVVMLSGLCYAMLLTTTAGLQGAEVNLNRTRALFAAQAGMEDAKRHFKIFTRNIPLAQPFGNLDALIGQTIIGETQVSEDLADDARYTVRVTGVRSVNNYIRDVEIESRGWVSDGAGRVPRTVRATLRLELTRSEVFDYVYFIHNWGWYYGDTISANGNVRSNGQFDGGNYRAEINGYPRFERLVNGTTLEGPIDDGGLFSGWNIVNYDRMRGNVNETWRQNDYVAGRCTEEMIGTPRYIHPFAPPIQMPVLADLTPYEEIAADVGAYIKIGDTVYSSGTLGAEGQPDTNLYLKGTNQNPIEIHGPNVVYGNVIISGVVKGQGSIYAARNVYIPENLEYHRGCTYAPTNANKQQIETWLVQNKDQDALGLFARQHIVVGDYIDSQWQGYVSGWVNDHRNESGEDAGLDQIPNTRAGRDGILGTDDDDIWEGDGVWTVDYYTEAHEAAGVIPPGLQVGDVIPGSGEDANGNGVFDDTVRMSEFSLPNRFISPQNWVGNVPPNGIDYRDVASRFIHFIEAALFTNNTIAMLTLDRNNELRFNGCIVARNEAIVYGTRRLVLNYDFRLLDDGSIFHLYLPRAWKAVEIVMWQSD